MSRTAQHAKRRPPGTTAAVVAVLLAAAASTFLLVAPTVATEHESGSLAAPSRAMSVTVRERQTDDGTYFVRETVTYASGRTEVREYVRPARIEHSTLLDEQPSAVVPIAALAIALAGFPLFLNATPLRRPSRMLGAALLGVGALLAGFSVGLVYLPSGVAMAVAAVRA